MTPAPESPRASRNRRRGDLFGLMTRLAAAAAVVIAIAILLNLGIHKLERSPPVQPEYQPRKPGEEVTKPTADVSALPQGIVGLEEKRSQVEQALKLYFQAGTVEERAKHVRHPERVKPLMEAYYLRHALSTRIVQGLGTCQPVGEKGARLGYIQVLFSSGSPVSVIIEETGEGQFRTDWESLVRFGEMEWDEFLKQKTKQAVLLRIIASGTPPDPTSTELSWLQVFSPGHEKAVKASFDPKDPQFQPLMEQLELGRWKNVPLTLRLCYSEPKSNTVSVCIAGVEGKGWLILN